MPGFKANWYPKEKRFSNRKKRFDQPHSPLVVNAFPIMK